MSGGTIGGIVGGVVGGLALIGVAGFLLYRRRKANSKGNHAPIASGPPSEPEEHGNPYEMNAFQQQYSGMAEAPTPNEKYAHHSGAPPASPYRDVPEVQGSAVAEQHVYEMPGSGPAELDGGAPQRRA